MSKKWIEIVGWYGVITILLAYLLNNFNILNTSNPIYSFLNLTGALGIMLDAWKQKNYQPVILNIVWASVALITLIKLFI